MRTRAIVTLVIALVASAGLAQVDFNAPLPGGEAMPAAQQVNLSGLGRGATSQLNLSSLYFGTQGLGVSTSPQSAPSQTIGMSPDLPPFEVDVQRRWPSVAKARRVLGWEARIGAHQGIAQTVAWLREHDIVAQPAA